MPPRSALLARRVHLDVSKPRALPAYGSAAALRTQHRLSGRRQSVRSDALLLPVLPFLIAARCTEVLEIDSSA